MSSPYSIYFWDASSLMAIHPNPSKCFGCELSLGDVVLALKFSSVITRNCLSSPPLAFIVLQSILCKPCNVQSPRGASGQEPAVRKPRCSARFPEARPPWSLAFAEDPPQRPSTLNISKPYTHLQPLNWLLKWAWGAGEKLRSQRL